jgi:formylglycine-generating enzyme required for sulfatase activity
LLGVEGSFTAGVLLNAAQLADDSQIEAEFVIDSSEPALLVQRFRETASPIARRLAEMMAAVPVSPSIIRLIQRNLLPQAGTVHLAEVFLSGLLQRVAPVEDEPQGLPHRYEFFDGVRQQLLRVVLIPDTEQVMDRVADDVLKRLPSEVRQQLSEDIERRLGRSMRSFEAFLLPELLEDLAIDEKAKAEVLPFAAVTREVLQGLGGEYAKLAERIQQVPQEVPSLVSPRSEDEPFPSLLEFEFETGVIDETLQPFEFTVATIELQARRRGKPKLVIHREQKQAWQFVETLGEVGLEMVSIPGGSFLMGSPENEPERYDNESPQHSVSVSSFFMGKYPITQAQWRIVAEFEQVNRSLNPDPSRFKGDDRPVENVSWLEAVEFCERLNRFVEVRLSRFTGKEYRLPTEAEWEYACRAGTQIPFHFGETITTDLASYDGNYAYGEGVKGQYREKTTPVGSFKVANSFGLYDMHGNVWEWCQDHWHKSYAGAPIDGSAWIDPDRDEEASRVLRGGSWINDPGGCRSATRVCAGVCQ